MTLPHMSGLRRFGAQVLDLLYPGVCAVCGRVCDELALLCGQCDARLVVQQTAPVCGRCAKPLAQKGDPCPWCLGKGIYPYRQIVRLGIYVEPLRDLIQHMKYHRRWPIGEVLAMRLMEDAEARRVMAAERIVAVPLHFRRHFWRGYNQSEVIGRILARRCGAKLVRAVRRRRDTESQTQLQSGKARRENVKGAFELVRPKEIAGKQVVVVDDVMTSGATLQEVGRELMKGEPASLSAVVLAVADPRGQGFEAV